MHRKTNLNKDNFKKNLFKKWLFLIGTAIFFCAFLWYYIDYFPVFFKWDFFLDNPKSSLGLFIFIIYLPFRLLVFNYKTYYYSKFTEELLTLTVIVIICQQALYIASYLFLLTNKYQEDKVLLYDVHKTNKETRYFFKLKNSYQYDLKGVIGNKGDCYLVNFRENKFVFEVRLKQRFSKNSDFCQKF